MAWVRLAPRAALARDSAVRVEIDALEIALFDVGGELHAVGNRCPHFGGPLVEGVVSGPAAIVTCPWHQWRYSLRTGARVDRRGSPIPTHSVRADDGWITVEVPDL